MDRKTADYDRETERARLLQATASELERKLNETLERNRDLQSNETVNNRAFQEEMQICKDLLAQYEKIANEAKARVEDIENEEETIRSELAKREETLLAQTERERERAQAAERKVEELEEVLQRMQTGEFSITDASFTRARTPMSPGSANPNVSFGSLMLSPTASIVSKFQRGGKSITEVYAEYVRLQKELQQAKQENARLEVTLKDIFNEIQDRAPVITQQRLEYDRISAEARQLASQLSEAIEERDQQSRAAREAKHTLAIKQKEVELLNKQLSDLSRQVRALSNSFEPVEEYTNASNDVDAYISNHLVTFRNTPELLQRYQELLRIARELSAKLDERNQKDASEEEDEVMAEARMMIEGLRAQLKASESKLDAYIQERDLLRKKVAQLQSGGAAGDVSVGSIVLDGGEDYHRKYDEEHAALEVLRVESKRGFDTLRAELKQAKAESTEAHVALGKARATIEYHNGKGVLILVCI